MTICCIDLAKYKHVPTGLGCTANVTPGDWLVVVAGAVASLASGLVASALVWGRSWGRRSVTARPMFDVLRADAGTP